MNEKRNLIFTAALCGLAALTAGCSRSWIAGDPPEVPAGAYIGDVTPEAKPEVKPETPAPAQTPDLKAVEMPETKPELKPEESIPISPDIRYTVQKNDSLSEISRVYSVPVEAIAERNGLAKTAKLIPGQVIFIPTEKVQIKDARKTDDVKDLSILQKKEEKPVPVKDEQPAKAETEGAKTVIHVVKEGDMLSKLGVKYKVPYIEIAKANKIKVDSVLRIGQKLVIPLDKAGKTGSAKKATAPKADTKAAAKKEVKAEPVKKPAADQAPAAEVKKPAAAETKAPAAPAVQQTQKPAAATADDDGGFFSSEAGSEEVTAPAAKPAAATAGWTDDDIMTVSVSRDMSFAEFASANGRSETSIRMLNPQLDTTGMLKKGPQVKLFIDPNFQK